MVLGGYCATSFITHAYRQLGKIPDDKKEKKETEEEKEQLTATKNLVNEVESNAHTETEEAKKISDGVKSFFSQMARHPGHWIEREKTFWVETVDWIKFFSILISMVLFGPGVLLILGQYPLRIIYQQWLFSGEYEEALKTGNASSVLITTWGATCLSSALIILVTVLLHALCERRPKVYQAATAFQGFALINGIVFLATVP